MSLLLLAGTGAVAWRGNAWLRAGSAVFAALVLMNALHAVSVTQGVLSEHVGFFTIRAVSYYAPNPVADPLTITQAAFRTTIVCNQDTLRLLDGPGRWGRLQFDETHRIWYPDMPAGFPTQPPAAANRLQQ